MQEYEGNLNFATDAWTSPNHKAFVAVSVHLKYKGKPLCIILDVVEVATVNDLLLSLSYVLTPKSSHIPVTILLLPLRKFWTSMGFLKK